MKRGNGFTLIELLVAIAIISILAAILFPVFVAPAHKKPSMFHPTGAILGQEGGRNRIPLAPTALSPQSPGRATSSAN